MCPGIMSAHDDSVRRHQDFLIARDTILKNDLLRQGAPRRAVRYFSKSLRLHPADVWALNNRGLAYLKAGNHEKARKDFEDALRIEPGFEQARKNLAGMNSSH